MQARLEKAEKQAASHAEQNQSLKRENEELRRQLGLEVCTYCRSHPIPAWQSQYAL